MQRVSLYGKSCASRGARIGKQFCRRTSLTLFAFNGCLTSLRESNARLIKWSDGTMQLHVAKDVYEVTERPSTQGSVLRLLLLCVPQCHVSCAPHVCNFLFSHVRGTENTGSSTPSRTMCPPTARSFQPSWNVMAASMRG